MVDCQNIFILGDIKMIILIAWKCRRDIEAVVEPFKMLWNKFYTGGYIESWLWSFNLKYLVHLDKSCEVWVAVY